MILNWFVHHKRFGRFRKWFDRTSFSTRPLETFPRIIHIYWHSDLGSAPALVQRCVRTWAERNPEWELRLWDHAAASGVISWGDLPEGLKITPYSDILRTELLRRFGGVWADATLWCNRPLDDWLLQTMVQTDFFAFSRPGADRSVASWFLASRPESEVVTRLASAVSRYWKRRHTPTRVYHWFQYVFEYLERTSPEFRRNWRRAPAVSAAPMLALQIQLVGGSAPDAADVQLYRALAMHKLTYKRPLDVRQIEEILGA
jgi:hypothetical protein